MKRILIGLVFFMSMGSFLAHSEVVSVSLTHDKSFTNTALISKMESSLSEVLSEINRAQSAETYLNLVGMNMDDFAKKSLSMLWANVHFYCDDEEVVDRLWIFENGFMSRQIPLIITPVGENFGSGTYQEAIVEFNKQGKITDFRFAFDAHLSESMEKCGPVVELERRMKILSYCERFRTAYNTKDLDFLEQVFSDDALIITGNVVKTKENKMKVSYKKQGKKEYLASLKRAFLRNKWIDVKFSQIGDNGEVGGCPGITQSSENPNYYGVRLRQEWRSSSYNDEGYVFLLWDFTDENHPIIHVRTWQPEWVGGERLPEKEIFSLSDFDLL